jgi:hypothetical protein
MEEAWAKVAPTHSGCGTTESISQQSKNVALSQQSKNVALKTCILRCIVFLSDTIFLFNFYYTLL